MIPSFPSITFPNHYTLVTGLYPESHGIVGNRFFDPTFNATFVYSKPEDNVESKWWNAEPVWITAIKQGLKTGICFWPGSEHKHDGFHSTYYKTYNSSTTHAEKLDWIFGWIDMPTPTRPSFIAVYFPDVDHAGHIGGVNSQLVADALMDVDRTLGRLYNGIRDRGLLDSTSIIVVSDHGMTNTAADQVVFIDDYVDINRITLLDNGPVYFIEPKYSFGTFIITRT